MNENEKKHRKTVAFITLGCKVNQYETNAMAQQFIEKGYELVEHHEKADIYIINTCTVTNISDRKSRQMLRRVKELNQEAKVIAVGCYAQVAREELEKIPEIDLAVGNEEKKEIVTYIEAYSENKEEVKMKDIMEAKEFSDFGEITFTEKNRAVIKVQDGCDRYCSYCIIPYARGRVRSRRSESVCREIEKITKEGIKEVVLTGIHIASYGKDFKEERKGYELIDLLEEVNKIEGIERIRLGSLEPLLLTEEFMQRFSKLEKACHHFHLSLQSGCDETLKRMNRRYSTEEFREIVERARRYDPEFIFTTDIIVGFPGETEEEFEKTYMFLKQINFYTMHIFKYSPRKGTKAASMKEQIDGTIKEKRSKKLIALGEENAKGWNERYLGKEVEVLWEEEKNGIYKGHTKNFMVVEYQTKEKIANKISTVTIEKAEENHLAARKQM